MSVVAVVVALGSVSPVAAQDETDGEPPARQGGSYVMDAGIGTACVLVNVLYMPAKLLYATLGGLTGGLAFVLTGANGEIADRIWAPSLGGNYVVTPGHLRNRETLYFSGVVEEE
jgi:hypothetical protein